MLFLFNSTRFYFLLFSFLSIISFAQSGYPVQVDAFPPAPNASSLGKFVSMPVSTYTGVPNVSIPIWEVKDGAINLPISLSYHAGGIQVAEVASWVGLGWALNAGGVITRTVRGLPDDLTNGFLSGANTLPTAYSSSQNPLFTQYADGLADSQPDLFTFSFGGYTGNFQFDQSGNIYLLPFQKIKIEAVNLPYKFTSWKVTTHDGFVYIFNVAETCRPFNNCQGDGFSSNPIEIYTSSWYLSSITTPSGATVSLEYTTGHTITYPTSVFEHSPIPIRLQSGGAALSRKVCTSYQDIRSGVRLSKIKFSTGEIVFEALTDRIDLPGDKELDQIIIKDMSGVVVRRFKMLQQYMYGNNLVAVPDLGYTQNDAPNYRLALLGVQELDATSNISKPPYKFEYEIGLPGRLSYSVDHWGFYNGQSNTTMVPEEVVLDLYMTGSTQEEYLPGAEKNPYLEPTKKGSMKQVTYPTGGNTKFTYELNEATNKGRYKFDKKSVQLTGSYGSNYAFWDKVPKSVAFTVNSYGKSGAYVKVDLGAVRCYASPGVPLNACGMFVAISKNENGQIGQGYLNSLSVDPLGTVTVFLPNGNYFLHCGTTSNDTPTTNYNVFTINASWTQNLSTPDYSIGGLRLARLEDTDPALGKSLVKNFEYKDPATSLSSGYVSNVPDTYAYITQTEKNNNGIFAYNLYRMRTSTPNVPLGLTKGGQVGYGIVTVLHGEQNTTKGMNGKTVYKYTSPYDYPDINTGTGFPFGPIESKDWKRGLLTESVDYKRNSDGTFVMVKRVQNSYDFYDQVGGANPNVKNCKGLKVGWYTNGQYLKQFVYNYFNFTTGYAQLKSAKEELFDATATTSTAKYTEYKYGTNHLMPIKTIVKESDGSLLTTFQSYPLDYTDNTGFIASLNAAHIVKTPIEVLSYRSDVNESNARIVSGKLTTYKVSPLGVLDKEYYLETSNPIPSSAFQFSTRSVANVIPPAGAASLFYQNPGYKLRVSYDQYDDKGKLLQFTEDGYPVSILWGYNKSLAIAQVKNASRNSDNLAAVWSECLYNGFEKGSSPGEYGWYDFDASKVFVDKKVEPDNVHSGRYALKINPAPSGGINYGPTSDMVPVLPQKGKYKLSCWIKTPTGFPDNNAALHMYMMKKGTCCDGYPNTPANTGWFVISPTNNQWQYFETTLDLDQVKTFAPNEDLVLRTYSLNFSSTYPIYIDDIRINTVDAQMETYTYDTQVGVSSITSKDNKCNTYEYDALGRLLNIKNHNGDILKSFTYVYGR